MLKHKSLILTIALFFWWQLTGAIASYLLQFVVNAMMAQSIQIQMTPGEVVPIIVWLQYGFQLIGTYFIVRYFLRQDAPPSNEKAKRIEEENGSQENPLSDALFDRHEEEIAVKHG